MNEREAKILALEFLSEWAWDVSTPNFAVREMVTSDEDMVKLAEAFGDLSLSLYSRAKRLKERSGKVS